MFCPNFDDDLFTLKKTQLTRQVVILCNTRHLRIYVVDYTALKPVDILLNKYFIVRSALV